MATITYEDKTDAINIPQYPDNKKVTADDLNEIKQVVNSNYQEQEQTNENVAGTFNSVNTDMSLIKQQIGILDDLLTQSKSNLVAAINELVNKINNISVSGSIDYPIGTILFNENADFDPNELYTGTWERIKGKYIVGVDEDDDILNQAGKTVGSNEHYHQYGIQFNALYAALYSEDSRLLRLYDGQTQQFVNASTNGSTDEIGNDGVRESIGSSFNCSQLQTITNTTSASNMPLSYTGYIWIRKS